MNIFQKGTLVALRIALGWLYFWAGITSVLNANWSAAGYLNSAKLFPGLYHWLASPTLLPITNLVNQWGLTLLGASLILGLFVRWTTLAGVVIMALYYLALGFPHPNPHAFIVDEHIIYIATLLTLNALNAGRIWGLDSRFK
ncbi:MAG TPA: DoxX family protein [Candidatus Paceibacterota bacterium]|nr:DoxX family protein [Candidatus Paceibacterota bacterium]